AALEPYLLRGARTRVGIERSPGVWRWFGGVFVRSSCLVLTGARVLRVGGRVPRVGPHWADRVATRSALEATARGVETGAAGARRKGRVWTSGVRGRVTVGGGRWVGVSLRALRGLEV